MKLQDAYISEVGVYIGNWKAIGYKMDNSSNFTYSEGEAASWTKNSADLATGASGTWTATNIATLNDCGASSVWSFDVSQNGSTGGAALYDAKITPSGSGSADNCEILTPSFVKMDTKDHAI